MAEDPVPELQSSKRNDEDTSIEIVPLGVKILEVVRDVRSFYRSMSHDY